MPDFVIERREPVQRLTLARTQEIQAQSPFVEQWQGKLWMLNREPYHHRTGSGNAARIALQLGARAIDDAAPGGVEDFSAPASGRATAAAPETLSWAWSINDFPPDATTFVAVSTPAIPWPFRIVGFSAVEVGNQVAEFILQMYLTADRYLFIPQINTLEPILPNIHGGLQDELFSSIGWRLPPPDVAGKPTPPMALATAVIGRTIDEQGKRITIAIKGDALNLINWSGTMTVERWGGTSRVTPRFTGQPAAPAPAPAPALAAPTLAPAPAAPTAAPAAPAPAALGSSIFTQPGIPATARPGILGGPAAPAPRRPPTTAAPALPPNAANTLALMAQQIAAGQEAQGFVGGYVNDLHLLQNSLTSIGTFPASLALTARQVALTAFPTLNPQQLNALIAALTA